MRKLKLRTKGEKFRPTVEILKVSKTEGTPTKIKINGHEYSLIHPFQGAGR